MKHVIKALGLTLLAAISMMALTAAAAHAEGQVRVEGKVLGEGENEAESEGSGGTWKLQVPGLGLTIQCTSILFNKHGGNLGTLSHLHGLVLKLYHGCTVVGNANCTIYPTEEDLAKKTNAGLIHLHALFLRRLFFGFGRDHYRLTVIPGLQGFSNWYYAGAKCALPEEAELSGTSAIAVPNATEEAVNHELQDITPEEEKTLAAEEMKLELLYGESPAESEGGNITEHLIGKNEGKKFSVN